MDLQPSPTPARPAQTRPLVTPPPMREVTKGWFTVREEAKTVEQLRKDDRERK